MAEKKNILICIDMQNDFIDGALANPTAAAIVPDVVKTISEFDGEVYATRDTHFENYLDTFEGKHLPYPHCIKGSHGWDYNSYVKAALENKNATFIDKVTFGYTEWPRVLLGMSASATQEQTRMVGKDMINSITLIGVCTDICVISNVLLLRAAFPDTEIRVIANCCAGLTKEKHDAALNIMDSTQITVVQNDVH